MTQENIKRKELNMAKDKVKPLDEKNTPEVTDETYRVAYMFESNVWGQAVFLEEPKHGMVLMTASDFDSGQTVRIGIDLVTFKKICDTGLTFITAEALSGAYQNNDENSSS
jgi:hypothetical protein